MFKNRIQNTLDAIIGESIISQPISCYQKKELYTYHNWCVVSLDFLKVFDRVGWDFIFFAPQKFGYGKKFMHMIQVAYTNIQS